MIIIKYIIKIVVFYIFCYIFVYCKIMKDKGKLWWRSTWVSICSAHQTRDSTCRICKCGTYRNVWSGAISSFIFRLTPKLWVWWTNQ